MADGEPKILLGARAEQAENSGGRQNLLAERRREALTARLAEAQGAVEQVRRLFACDFEGFGYEDRLDLS